METLQALRKFGFTQQESLLYVTLLRHGAMTGYEAAKAAGISRSNAYAALASLVDKGGAVLSVGGAKGDTSRYVPVSGAELLGNLRRDMEATLTFLEQHLPKPEPEETPYLTVSGLENTENKIRNMLQGASLRIYASMHSHSIATFREDLMQCVTRGLKVVVLSDVNPKIDGCIYYPNEAEPHYVKLIADTHDVIAGTLEPRVTGRCLYSCNEHLVHLMREAILHEMDLICIRTGMASVATESALKGE